MSKWLLKCIGGSFHLDFAFNALLAVRKVSGSQYPNSGSRATHAFRKNFWFQLTDFGYGFRGLHLGFRTGQYIEQRGFVGVFCGFREAGSVFVAQKGVGEKGFV
jgi:hypothetical protein